MCIIIAKKKGIKFDTIPQSIINASHNDDGMGFALKRKGSKKIYVSKGYFGKDYEDGRKALDELKIIESDELMVHLRWKTSGEINDLNCHPFIITEHQNDIVNPETHTRDIVISHNGVMNDYSYASSKFSDTYHFVKEFLSVRYMMDFLKDDPEYFEAVFTNMLKGNKFALMSMNWDMVLFNEKGFFEDSNGVLYSTTAFRSTKLNSTAYNPAHPNRVYDKDGYWEGNCYHYYGDDKDELRHSAIDAEVSEAYEKAYDEDFSNIAETSNDRNWVFSKKKHDNLTIISCKPKSKAKPIFDSKHQINRHTWGEYVFMPRIGNKHHLAASLRFFVDEFHETGIKLKCYYQNNERAFTSVWVHADDVKDDFFIMPKISTSQKPTLDVIKANLDILKETTEEIQKSTTEKIAEALDFHG